MRSRAPSRRDRSPSDRAVLRKVAASAATVALAAGLMAFAHYGRFADEHDPFPRSVVAQR